MPKTLQEGTKLLLNMIQMTFAVDNDIMTLSVAR